MVTPPATAFTSTSVATDRRDAGYKVFLGYQMNRYLGLEGGHFNLGKQGFKTTTTPGGFLDGEVRVQGANLDLVATVPLSSNLSLIGRAGATYGRTRTEFSTGGAAATTNPHPSDRSGNPKLGPGLLYAFNDHFVVRGEAEAYRVSDAVGGHSRINMYSVSLVFPFGCCQGCGRAGDEAAGLQGQREERGARRLLAAGPSRRDRGLGHALTFAGPVRGLGRRSRQRALDVLQSYTHSRRLPMVSASPRFYSWVYGICEQGQTLPASRSCPATPRR